MLNIDFAPTFLDFAGAKASVGHAGPQLPRQSSKATRRRTGAMSMYYRYWMHNDGDHHVPAHYGVRTKQYKLIYYYGKPLGMTGALIRPRRRNGNSSICRTIRTRCTISTPIRNTRTSLKSSSAN